MPSLTRNLNIRVIEQRDAVPRAGLQPRHAQRHHQAVVRHRELADHKQPLRLIFAHNTLRQRGGVRHINSPLGAVMNDIPPLLVQRGVMAIAFALLCVHGERIQLQPHMAKQSRQPAKLDTMLAEGGVALMMTDMRAHYLRREEVAHAALDGAALQRVVVVGRPEAVAAGQYLIINATAAGGAGFKLNMREALAQHVQQAVKLAGLGVGGGFALVPWLHQLAVHVPLHVVDRMLAQQPAHALYQVIKGLRDVEIEHQLVSSGRPGIARQRQYPVRMRTVQI